MIDEIPNRLNDDLPVKVIISGAGLAGLFLALLLEKLGTPYHLFERSPEIKPLGALMSLSSNVMPLFVQLGLYERLQEISLPVDTFTFYNGKNMKPIGNMVGEDRLQLAGYDTVVFVRHRLYDMILQLIPENKISFNKKIMSILQNKQGVMIRTSDNCSYHGDILVGADGAYSGVRQSLYKSMVYKEIMPSVDLANMSKGYVCLVGTTDPLDPKKYPCVLEPKSRAVLVLADDRPYNWSVFTVPGNRICWNVIIQQSKQESDETLFRNSYWGPESCNKMIADARDLRTPYGTMGDLIDVTPKDVISQVYLEDKLYGTWNHGRTVLIGDGAVNALQDAAILANCIHDLDSASYDDIQKCFESFKAERYPHVKHQYDTSQFTAKFMYGHTKKEKLIRALIFGWLPKWMKKKGMVKDMEYQPQVNFLPLVEPRGSIAPVPQKPSKKGFIEVSTPVLA
ncbi:hypothetical protein BGZ81_004524 [Podila clonocystis]|nr:hypothetical protein BGZ81_004524 [Podila clonocystis]